MSCGPMVWHKKGAILSPRVCEQKMEAVLLLLPPISTHFLWESVEEVGCSARPMHRQPTHPRVCSQSCAKVLSPPPRRAPQCAQARILSRRYPPASPLTPLRV